MANRNAHYWVNKEERKKKAIEHTKLMELQCPDMINQCVKSTKLYSVDFGCKKQVTDNPNMEIQIIDMDSVSALYGHDGKVAVLNFASYKNPGGMFINGSKAQEECLCHESFLYNVLKEFKDTYYAWNNKNKNKALYKNRALYSPNVLFKHNDEFAYADVITCAAPNISTGYEYQNVSSEENYKVMSDRTRFMLDIAKENEVDVLVLGAWGCGVFGQFPDEVAEIFKYYLTTTHKCFKKVIFAIPAGENLEEFKKVFK